MLLLMCCTCLTAGFCAVFARAALIKIEVPASSYETEQAASQLVEKILDAALPSLLSSPEDQFELSTSTTTEQSIADQHKPVAESEFDITDAIFGGLPYDNSTSERRHRLHRHHSYNFPCSSCGDVRENSIISWKVLPEADYNNDSEDDKQQQQQQRGSNLLKILRRHGAGFFAQLLKQTGAINDLSDGGPYTVFAPTDRAFERVLQKIKNYFTEHPDRLRMLLLFHVLKEQKLSLDALEDEAVGTFTTMFNDRKMRVKYYDAHDTLIAGSGLIVKSKSDIAFDNGLVHGIGNVVLSIPRNTSGEIIRNCWNFATFWKAVLSAGLESALFDPGPLTVFVPTEAAWAKLTHNIQRQIFNNQTALKIVVMYHMVYGTWYKEGLESGQQLETKLSDRAITVQRSADTGTLRINEVEVKVADVGATNGVMHILNEVLLPQEIQDILERFFGDINGESDGVVQEDE